MPLNLVQELSWVHKSQSREQRDLSDTEPRCRGQHIFLICLQTQPPTPNGGPMYSLLLLLPMNPVNSEWGYMPMSSLTGFVPIPFNHCNTKTKSNLPERPWQQKSWHCPIGCPIWGKIFNLTILGVTSKAFLWKQRLPPQKYWATFMWFVRQQQWYAMNLKMPF